MTTEEIYIVSSNQGFYGEFEDKDEAIAYCVVLIDNNPNGNPDERPYVRLVTKVTP